MFFNVSVSAQNKLAIIIDKDGFANLREYPNLKSKIIDTIKLDDFVYCDSLINDFYKIWEYKWYGIGINNGKQINGYVHKSRIKLIGNLSIIEQQKIILKSLNDYNNFIDERNLWYKNNYDIKSNTYKDSTWSIKNMDYSNAEFEIVDRKFDPILGYIDDYYCTTHDMVVLNKLFSILYNDQGSANEIPAWCLGRCFTCYPNPIVKSLNNMDKEKVNIIKGHIYYGLCRHFKINCEDNIHIEKNYNEYLKFTKLLDNVNK